MKSSTLIRGAAVLGLAAGVGGVSYDLGQRAVGPALAQPASSVAALSGASGSSGVSVRALPDFADIAERYGPAVVNVSVVGTTKTAGMQDLDPNSPFGEFYRRFGPPQMREIPRGRVGSGFIVDPGGVVLTNAHVVDGAATVTVKLTDQREFTAKVVGVDKGTDVAVLKIDAADLPAVKIGDSRKSRVGDWVVAIGSPFGLENTVTAGIMSAKGRALPDEGYVPFLQTDVAINPGNSGGPLFNLDGEVIGINSQIYSRSGGYQGLSFAIPIDVAMNVEKQLTETGKVSRGRLGIMVQGVDQGLSESFGLPRPGGALVASVERGSPAEKAGLQPGDVITKFNGHEIKRSSELPPLVAEVAPGTKVPAEVWRDRSSHQLQLTVTEAPADRQAASSGSPMAQQGKLGLAVRPLTSEERKEADVVGGLMVEEVAGAAERAGVQPGDVVLSFNGRSVGTADELRSAAEKATGKRGALLVLRENTRIFIPIRLG